MDSYDLFGEDGTGMLEGLADLGSDNFDDNAAPVGAPPRDAPNQPGLVLYLLLPLTGLLFIRLFCCFEAGTKQLFSLDLLMTVQIHSIAVQFFQ